MLQAVFGSINSIANVENIKKALLHQMPVSSQHKESVRDETSQVNTKKGELGNWALFHEVESELEAQKPTFESEALPKGIDFGLKVQRLKFREISRKWLTFLLK